MNVQFVIAILVGITDQMKIQQELKLTSSTVNSINNHNTSSESEDWSLEAFNSITISIEKSGKSDSLQIKHQEKTESNFSQSRMDT